MEIEKEKEKIHKQKKGKRKREERKELTTARASRIKSDLKIEKKKKEFINRRGKEKKKTERERGIHKSKNTGITSVDRSTKATLSTYNPWIQLSRLQKIYHFQHQKL